MNIAVFGLGVSSSWGNGHATQWRSLARALARHGARLTFFERDQPFYASHRDATSFAGIDLVLYDDWLAIEPAARATVDAAEAAIVTSFCPDGPQAAELVREASRLPVYYDLDTPVTLASLDAGTPAPYLPRGGLAGFEVVLSFTGGPALEALARRLGAVDVRPLFGCVDTDAYAAQPEARREEVALTYLGTYAADRQRALASLFLEAARRLPERAFVIGGAQYPPDFPWTRNVHFVRHVEPTRHPSFYGAAPLTLNVTRASMARLGHCPSARLFEAAACEAAVVSDVWPGLERFFRPGEEILLARTVEDVLAAIALGPEQLGRIGKRARERVLAEHSAERRARELLSALEAARVRQAGARAS
ncbi:MAG TPA: glycosyltransferase [Polyangia bacterium]|nr:glycosyltransferase [Polyangia bacterium]